MNIHATIHVDSYDELSITLPQEENKTLNISIGKVVKHVDSSISELSVKTFIFREKSFNLDSEDIVSLKQRLISHLPFSNDTKEVVEAMFDRIFYNNTVSEEDITRIVDLGADLERYNRLARRHLLEEQGASQLTKDEQQFVVQVDEQFLEEFTKLDKPYRMESYYQDSIAPLKQKAKAAQIKQLSAVAAAEKGKAFQAGLNTISQIEKGSVAEKKLDSEKVRVFPSTKAVFKSGSKQSKEEEEQIDALMSMSMEKGSVSFFTFSQLSTQRFGAEDSTNADPQSDLKKPSGSSALFESHAKPYIDGMLTFNDLLSNPKLYQSIISRLTIESEFKAVLTEEFQFLDLHHENLGIVPIVSKDDVCFCNCTFSYGLKTSVPFSSLLQDFLSGKIKSSTKVFCSSDKKELQSKAYTPISEIPHLLDALNSRWEFVLFDTDQVLSENNAIHYQKRGNLIESQIPFRSVLLGFDWKDKTLSPETIKMLKASARNMAVRDWVERKDAPIRQWLKESDEIDKRLKPMIEQEKYTLSYYRSKGIPMTVKELKSRFALDLSQLERNYDFWRTMQMQLQISGWFKPHRVKEGESLDDIAEQYGLKKEALIRLNPFLVNESLHTGMNLRVKEDLTSDSLYADKQRKTIALQFFPRLSWKQRNALYERQRMRDEFLTNIKHYQEMEKNSAQCLTQLESLILSPSTPIDSTLKLTLLKTISKLENEFEKKDFDYLVEKLNHVFNPTYFNLAKAMYPLLADVYELNLHAMRLNKQAGMNIGLYTKPLEELLSEAESAPLHSSILPSIEHLKRSLVLNKTKPMSFFGEWDETPPQRSEKKQQIRG